ncbi:hypothetical protein [Saccharospirillum mangrovi]|uniref:hypothetical protein n=1 Tax=Saccharospirillum mangrovi TaxID=2161747 RepID=UPI000D3C2F09|nr:hypothetical protein [Saccharospirillum mangrovi]
MLNLFFKRQKHHSKNHWPTENGIVFIHHQPAIYNIGDDLCSPRHYFNFETDIDGLTILGGGAYSNYGLKTVRKEKLNLNRTISWATGESTPKKALPHIAKLPYAAWGIRDRSRTSESNFLPCPSCLNSFLESPPGDEGTLLFLNADPRVTDSSLSTEYQSIAYRYGWKLLFNNCSIAELTDALQTSKRVITNSYHGAYWSLLSGHNLVLLGYSSKFTGLFDSLNLDSGHISMITKGSGKQLLQAIKGVIEDEGIRLVDHKLVLNEFRKMNIEFAKTLCSKGLIHTFRLKR